MSELNQQKEHNKQRLKNKVDKLAKTVHETKPPFRDLEEAMSAVTRMMYMANIHKLKEFLVDRDCKGEKPRLMVESAYTRPETGIPADVVYLPYNEPKYHQDMLDMLKKQELIPPNSTIEDYDFLFEGELEKK